MRREPEEATTSPDSQELGRLEFVIEGESARILTMVRGYFESDEWPYREKSTVMGPDLVSQTRLTCVVDQPYNPLGCLVWLVLFVVSFGSAILLWLTWIIGLRQDFLPKVVVTAYPEGSGVCKVSLASEKKPEYAEPVAAWIQRELVEKKRAVEGPQRTTPSGSNTDDIPEQLRKLAELRDAGVISAEEFEGKKKDLLDRM